jgi:3',5'-cyclic-AMP phosphodiesterase
MPVPKTDRFVIAQFSDLHCGDPRFDEHLLDRVIDEVNDLCPDLVAIPGDLTVHGYLDEYEMAKTQIDRLECPEIIVIPGNHDSRNVGYVHFKNLFGERWTSRDLTFASRAPELNCDNVRVVSLDSSKPDLNDGELGRHRYGWLAERLQDSPGLRIVVLHHHLVGIPGTGRERNIVLDAGDVLEILDRYSVDLVLAGHRHVPYAWKVNGVLVVTSGTASTWRTRGETPPSYNIVTILPDEIEVTIVALDAGGSRSVQRFARGTNRSA